MPSVTIPLPDIEQIVVRPTVYQVIDQVRDILGMTKDAEVIYAGKRGIVRATGSAISELNQDNEAKFSSDNYITIEVVEDYDTDAVQEIQSHSWDNAPVFSDPKLNFSLRPIYLPSKMEITFSYQSTNETEVRQWVATQITKANRGRDTHLHHIVYSYPLPMEFLIALDDVHRLREANEGYGESLMEYFNNHRVNRVSVMTNQAGEKAIPVIREKQAQIVGAFDFTVSPEKPEFIKEKGVWASRFVYRYTYWRPDQCFLHYPIAVHNDFMPDIYLKHLESAVDYDTRQAYYSHGMAAANMFALGSRVSTPRYPAPRLVIPSYDDFDPEVKKHTATIFMARCFLDETKRDLISLHELGDYEIDSDVMEFLSSEYPYLSKLFFSVFHVEHYINGELQHYEKLEVTPDLMIRSREPLSMRDVHHVRLAGLPEINHPLYNALRRLAEHPRAFVKVISSFNELLAADPDFGSLADYSKIEEWMFGSVYRVLNMMHQGNFHSTGTNIDSYIDGMIFTDKNPLGLLTKFHPSKLKDHFETKRRLRLTTMNTAIFVRKRADLQ